MKTILPKAAALALVAGLAGIAHINASSAEPKYEIAAPNLKRGEIYLSFECAAGFTKTEGTHSYTCHRNFVLVCRKGTWASEPVLKQVGKYWRVEYQCNKPPA